MLIRPGIPQAIGALVIPIDLRGWAETDVFVTAAAFDPTSTGWWKVKKPELAGADIVSLAMVSGSLKVTGENGTVYSYPGPLADAA